MRSERDLAESVTPRVLVVEDEPLIRLCIADALREFGYTVIEAATADEAWSQLSADGPVDLVFTDHNMPGKLTGAALADRIARHWPGLPVVITSGDFDSARYAGRFVKKPYDVFEIASELAEMLRSKNEGTAT